LNEVDKVPLWRFKMSDGFLKQDSFSGYHGLAHLLQIADKDELIGGRLRRSDWHQAIQKKIRALCVFIAALVNHSTYPVSIIW